MGYAEIACSAFGRINAFISKYTNYFHYDNTKSGCFITECSQKHPCEGLNRHAHFKNFGVAFLTLFRVATGDNWNGIMKVSSSVIHVAFFASVDLFVSDVTFNLKR